MHTRRLALATLIGSLLTPAGLAQSPGFDLIEINAAPGPLDPGVTFTFLPSQKLVAECAGISVADVNADSFLDMLICGIEGRPNELYINNGNGTFTESAAAFGIQETARRRGNALFFDLDNDGDLDLLTCGYPGQTVLNLDLYSLYRNDGAEAGYHFTGITSASGGFVLAPTIESTIIGIPAGAIAGDYDNDGFIDLLVTYWYRNSVASGFDKDQFRLWHNVPNPAPDLGQPDYTPRLLVDATLAAGLDGAAKGQVWMPSFVDVNRDGRLDLHIDVELDPDELRLNNGDGTFGPNIATSIGLNFNGPTDWGNEMGTALADYDNDGDLDAYLTNTGSGAALPIKADAFYRNDTDLSIGGAGLAFTHIGAVPGVDTDATLGIGWGASFADLDNDGDRDLVNARGLGANSANNYVWINDFPALASDGASVAMHLINADVPGYSKVGGPFDTARSLAAFDFDNDGDLDLVVTRTGEAPPKPANNLHAGFFLNTLSNGHPSLQVSLKEEGGSLNTVGAWVTLRTGGVGGVLQMADVRAGSSFLAQEPDRLHFGLGSAEGADWVAVRWFDGAQQVLLPSGPPLAGFVEIARTGPDATGDLDGDGLTGDSDLALLVLALVHPADVDAAVPGWPWRQTADADGNGLFDVRDIVTIRAIVGTPFASLGNGHAGTHGLPTLSGDGPLTAGSTATFSLAGAREDASWWLLFGLGLSGGGFKGGILVPTTNYVIGPLGSGPSGAVAIPATWPAIPSGTQISFQAWIVDPEASQGFAATNGLSALAH